MKLKNNWLSSKSSKNIDFFILGGILLFCLVYRIVYFGFINNDTLHYSFDSITYFTSSIFDLYRTPVYPLIIKLFESISKDNFLYYLVYFQQFLSFLSIIPVFYLLRNTLKNRGIIIITTLVYACIPHLIDLNICILTECLSIVGSTFILFLFSYYIKKPQKSIAFCLGFFPFILIMLKPAYLIMLCLMFLFFTGRFIFCKNEKRILHWGMIGLFIAILGVWGYCEMNKRTNGEFTLTKVSLFNSLENTVISGAYKYGGDEELISLIDSTKQEHIVITASLLNNEWIDYYKIQNEKFPKNLIRTSNIEFCLNIPDTENYSYARLNRFVKESQHTKLYFEYISMRLIKIFLSYKLLPLSFIILFELIMMLLLFLKHKKILWMLSFCILFIIGQLITIAIGGLDDWRRLILPTYPFIILVFSLFIDMIWSCRKKLIEVIYDYD